MDKKDISLENELKLMNELVGKRVIGFEKNINDTKASVMIIEDGTRFLVEMTDWDCCAWADGHFSFPSDFKEGLITNISGYEYKESDGYESERFAIITMLFENEQTAEIRMSANNGNGDYYMSVATLIARPIPEINNGTSFAEDMREQDKNDRWVYSLRSY